MSDTACVQIPASGAGRIVITDSNLGEKEKSSASANLGSTVGIADLLSQQSTGVLLLYLLDERKNSGRGLRLESVAACYWLSSTGPEQQS